MYTKPKMVKGAKGAQCRSQTLAVENRTQSYLRPRKGEGSQEKRSKVVGASLRGGQGYWEPEASPGSFQKLAVTIAPDTGMHSEPSVRYSLKTNDQLSQSGKACKQQRKTKAVRELQSD